MKQKPKCMKPNCKNDALLQLVDIWLCGDCFQKWSNQRSQKLIEEILNG